MRDFSTVDSRSCRFPFRISILTRSVPEFPDHLIARLRFEWFILRPERQTRYMKKFFTIVMVGVVTSDVWLPQKWPNFPILSCIITPLVL